MAPRLFLCIFLCSIWDRSIHFKPHGKVPPIGGPPNPRPSSHLAAGARTNLLVRASLPRQEARAYRCPDNTVQSGLHTYCTFLTSHCVLLTAHFTLHTAHCTLHTTHCTLHTAHCILHTANCTLQHKSSQALIFIAEKGSKAWLKREWRIQGKLYPPVYHNHYS